MSAQDNKPKKSAAEMVDEIIHLWTDDSGYQFDAYGFQFQNEVAAEWFGCKGDELYSGDEGLDEQPGPLDNPAIEEQFWQEVAERTDLGLAKKLAPHLQEFIEAKTRRLPQRRPDYEKAAKRLAEIHARSQRS